MKTINRKLGGSRACLGWLVLCCAVPVLSACGGEDSSDSTQSVTASLGVSVKNVPLVANQPSEISFTYTVPGSGSPSPSTPPALTAKGDVSINISETLKQVTLSAAPLASNDGSLLETLRLLAAAVIKDAFAQDQAQLTVFVSYAGDPAVCSSPYRFGPYTILGAVGSAVTSDTESDSLTDVVVDITNAGSFEVCLVTTPPIDAYLTVTGVVVDYEDCAEPTVNIANSDWVGTYSCENFGVGNEEGDVAITITRNQDGSYHYTDESGAEYDGHLCGNKFKFSGGLASSDTESGTLVFPSNTTAQKTSTWNSIPPGFSGGRCADSMVRL